MPVKIELSDMPHIKDTKLAVAIGFLIGTLSFLFLFGLDRAIGTDPAYAWPAGDQAQHIAGAYAYLDGAWTFPLFNTDRINNPDGVNIIFTDSAPFAGLLAKIVTSLTGWRFNYLGAWFCVLWVGQATAGAYLVRQLGLRHPVFYACGAIFALAWPAFLNRHFHLALGSHFLLLFALGFYFKTARSQFSWSMTLVWGLLLGVAIWTHAYLFLMSFAVFVAAYGDAWRAKNLSLLQAFLPVCAVLLWCICLALIGGYQQVGNINATGYGSFRLDLLAYVWPHGSSIINAPVIFDPQSAFEGYNYLGLGGITVMIIALFLVRKQHLKIIFRRHPLMVLCVIGMLAFAITNTISFGGKTMTQIPIATNGFPFSTFRASGRFGWPFGYLTVFCALALLVRFVWARRPRAALCLAVALTGLQLADTTRLIGALQEGFRSTPKPLFEAAVEAASLVYFEPPIDCIAPGPVQTAAIEVLAIAARAGKLTDSAHTARMSGLNCAQPPHGLAQGSLAVVVPETPRALYYEALLTCAMESGLLMCGAPVK